MIKKINIEDLQCACVRNSASNSIVYMIYPLVNGFDDRWLESQAEKSDSSIVVVYVPLNKWNDYLTPWYEPGETPKSEPFAGDGAEFLKLLQGEVVPEAEKILGLDGVIKRNLVGVSLGGLFTLWQWLQCDTFSSIGCLSGSFWYAGFMEWFEKQPIPEKKGKAYFLLGTDEPKANIKAYRSVGVNTGAIVSALKNAGICTTFEWVSGNHFANPLQRAEKALEAISPIKK